LGMPYLIRWHILPLCSMRFNTFPALASYCLPCVQTPLCKILQFVGSRLTAAKSKIQESLEDWLLTIFGTRK
jgi:hypothetical protein